MLPRMNLVKAFANKKKVDYNTTACSSSSPMKKSHYPIAHRVVTFFVAMHLVIFLSGQSILSKKVDFETSDTPISDALIDLSEAANINIAFHPRLFSQDQKISLAVKNKSLQYVLQQCLVNTDVAFKMDGEHLLLYQRPPKRYTISGYIEDAVTGERLIAATIWEAYSGKGTTSNDYGFFSLKIPEGEAELHSSYLGYQSSIKIVVLNKNKSISLKLAPSITLKEIIVNAADFTKGQAHLNLNTGTAINLQNIKTNISLGGEADLMQYLSTKANIQSGSDGIGGLNVRGGDADQNLFLLDGVPIYNPSHTLGLFSIFNTHIIKNTLLFTDGFSAKYGGRLSSVIDVRVKEGNTKEWKAEAEIGTLASKLIVEGPLKKDTTGLLIAFRRTHLDSYLRNRTTKSRAKIGENGAIGYYFFDLNAKLHHRLSNKDQLFLSFYTGQDDFEDFNSYVIDDPDYFSDNEYEQNINWGNQIAALRWNHLFGEQLFSNTTFTYSSYKYGSENFTYYFDDFLGDIEEEYYYTTFKSTIKDIGLKIDFEYYPNPNHHLLFGGGLLFRSFESGEASSVFDDTTIGEDLEETGEIFEELYELPIFKATELNAYVEDKVSLTDQFSYSLGLHLAAFITSNKTYVLPQPRIAAQWNFLPKWSTTLSGSKMSQFLHIISTTGGGFPNDLWVPSTNNVRPQESLQATWNLSYTTNKGWQINQDIFYKKLDHLISYLEDANLPSLLEIDPVIWEEEITTGTGKSYGWSTTIAKTKGRLTGQANYTYSVSERQFEFLNDGLPYSFRYNHPHSIKINLQQQLNKKTAFNINWNYGSGQPISLLTTTSRFAPLSNLQGAAVLERIGRVNSYRLPAYHRLDLGFYFEWASDQVQHHLNLGVYNLYNRKNPYYVYRVEDFDFPEDNGLKQQNSLPILPSLSYRVVF